MRPSQGKLDYLKDQADNLCLIFSGRLNLNSTAELWDSCMQLLQPLPNKLILDMHEVSYCDGAGIGLILELKARQEKNNKQVELQGLQPHLQRLVDVISRQKAKASESKIVVKENFVGKVGRFSVEFVANIRDNIIFLGSLSYQFWQTIRHPKNVRWQDMWRAAEEVGPNALSIIVLIGFLVGLISAFQSVAPFSRFGAQIYIANLVGLALVREMGPLMTAVLLAGRTASSFAAEIGTMKINQEVDALATMGLNPIKFLTVPKIIATIIMTPILNVLLILFALIGCGIVMHTIGFTLDVYLRQLEYAIHLQDFLSGLAKAFVFGIVIAAVGCLHGLKTSFGARAVGRSTTQAVVSSLIMIVIVDGIFACVYYVLGI